MKKLFLSLLVVAAVSFTACGGAAKTETTETPATETTEVAAPAVETVATDSTVVVADSTAVEAPVVAEATK